jgi:PAS domain S-box-containing protein
LELTRFLRIAISLADALGQVHARGLIHKDLKPANILVDSDTGEVHLTGFGLASRLPRERPAPVPPEVIAGTLAYMAPEQTGRMNRSVDSRSDLYSLGVIFYEMLAAVLPCTAGDPMEWIHCHVARQLIPLSELAPEVPAAVSGIVMKLLAKMPEDRYQTAACVASDLRRCLAQWEWGTDHQIEAFPLGAHDISDRLRIPEKLYGREREVAMLLEAFEWVRDRGRAELLLVSGYAGIGKSSVVDELHKVLVPARGLFVSGKFDQYKRDIPYATVAQAFQSLMRQLLVKDEEELGAWRAAIRAALGSQARLVTDLVPELELVIGPQPSVPEIPTADAQNRFLAVLGRFLGVFARQEHPLVLFLDDLQWLDAATLRFIEHVTTRAGVEYLLLIGAFRDNEVSETHPLMLTLNAIRQAGANVHQIVLAPLTVADLTRMVADSLHDEPARVHSLAGLVHEKTGGNPFFAIQFLTVLWEERLLEFDGRGAWRWDLERIRSKGYTDNVVDLMAGKLQRLPPPAREVLKELACLGSLADASILRLVHGRSEEKTRADLWEAVRAGYVLCSDGVCRFVHDRVQEAAYQLIPEPLRAAEHLRIGRLLVSHLALEVVEERVFDIVNQLNRGSDLIRDPEERRLLCRLNALAGRKAKGAVAYASALAHFVRARALLPAQGWDEEYAFTFALTLDQAECDYLAGNFPRADELFIDLLARARSHLDRAGVHRLRLRLYAATGRFDDSWSAGLEALRLFGVSFPDSDAAIREATEAEMQAIGEALGGRPIADLAVAPVTTEPDAVMTIALLGELVVTAYIARPDCYPLLTVKGVHASLRHGNTVDSSEIYSAHAVTLVAAGDLDSAFAFSEMALRLAERFQDEKARGVVLFRHGVFVNHWRRHMATSLPYLEQSFRVSREAGDLLHAGWAGVFVTLVALEAGLPLEEVKNQCALYAAYTRENHHEVAYNTVRLQQQHLAVLQGQQAALDAAEAASVARALTESKSGTAYSHILNLITSFFDERFEEAREWAVQVEPLLGSIASSLNLPSYHFYLALTLAALYPQVHAARQREFGRVLDEELRRFASWAQDCPANFRHRHALVAAEVARVQGLELDSERLYEEAIRGARDHGFIQDEALANELAGRCYRDRGFQTIALAYLREARYGYQRWGAHGKVRQLDRRYPRLAEPEPLRATATMGAPVEQLDTMTVVKASQAVSGELVLDHLIQTLLRIALEHAGAERGLLILPREEDYRIEAEAATGREAVQVVLRRAPLTPAELPESVLRYVLRTRETLILDDAASSHLFSADAYVRRARPRSILCLPLVRQTRLAGALYLENNLTTGAFTPGRVAVLELIASQAAISLENAALYADVQEGQARIRRLVESNIIGVFFWDHAGNIKDANDAFLDIVGYSRQDLLSGNIRWTDMTPPEHRAADERAAAEQRATGSCRPYEKEYVRKDGSRVPVLLGGTLFEGMRDEGVAFVLDLTERKRAEEAVRESRRLLQSIIDNSTAVIYVKDLQGRYLLVNRQFEETFHVTRESVAGRTDYHLFPKERADAYRAFDERVIAAGIPQEAEEEVPHDDGVHTYISLKAPLCDQEGRPQAVCGISTDITERKQMDRMKDEFISTAAHELRTPLTTVMGYVELLLTHEQAFAPEERKEFLELVYSSSGVLERLINDLLDLSTVQAGRLITLKKSRVDLAALASRAVTAWQGLTDRHQFSFEFAETQVHLCLDAGKIGQVLENLLSNAVKFSHTGGRIGVIGRRCDGEFEVTVEDEGIGMRPEQVARIFDKFYRADATNTAIGGLGLGMSIVRNIVEAHGGRIWVESEPGRGTRVHFTLPGNDRAAECERMPN